MHRSSICMPAAGRKYCTALLLAALFITPVYAQVATPQIQEPDPIQATQIETFTMEDAELVQDLQQVIDLALDGSFQVYQLEQSYLQTAYSLEMAQRNLKTRVDLNSTIPVMTENW